jgi:hypothetical protein
MPASFYFFLFTSTQFKTKLLAFKFRYIKNKDFLSKRIEKLVGAFLVILELYYYTK